MVELFNRTPQARAFGNARACGVRLNNHPKHLIQDRVEYKFPKDSKVPRENGSPTSLSPKAKFFLADF